MDRTELSKMIERDLEAFRKRKEMAATTPGSFYFNFKYNCYVGNLNGKKMSLKKVWGGHEFTYEEAERLFRGEVISVPYVSRNGKACTTTGRLMIGVRTTNGIKCNRFVPEFDPYFETDYSM